MLAERPGHDRGDVNLVLAREREELGLMLAQVASERRGVGEPVAGERGEAGCMAFERDLVAPFVVHKGAAPIEKNRLEHGR